MSYHSAAVIAVTCWLAMSFALVHAQDPLALGQQAEQAGNAREAVQQYTLALQTLKDGSAEEAELREKIIDLVRGLDPKPAIPEEAERRFIRGGTIAKNAKSVEDYARAAGEFRAALRLAPWWADAHINSALVQEQAHQAQEAIRSLKLYLRARPDAPDASSVKRKIFALEVAAEDQTYKRFEGIWTISSAWSGDTPPKPGSPISIWILGLGGVPNIIAVTVSGPKLTIRAAPNATQKPADFVIEAEIKEGGFMGTSRQTLSDPQYQRCFGGKIEDSVSGALHPEGKIIYMERKVIFSWDQTCKTDRTTVKYNFFRTQ